ncbi:MAG TPA: ABC transporter permease [Mucilaginibacter sp.]|nr:ABC transporter permease [Mucilaginibacter sp.]
MIKNYLKIAWRNIVRHKAYTFINLSGLAIGMASSILILLWVQNELSYDRFNKNADNIYRITCDASGFKAAVNTAGMPGGLKQQMPEIKNTVRLSHLSTVLFAAGDQKFQEKQVFYADSTFLQVFSYKLVEGNRATALSRSDGVLLTQDMAKKYFGSEKALGKVLRKDNGSNVTVTGVLANIPANSHLQFDFILPMSSIAQDDYDLKSNTWSNFNFYSYLLLDKNAVTDNASLARFEKKMNAIYKTHQPDQKIVFHIQPLTGIHLAEPLQVDLPGHGNSEYVTIFFIVAVLILVVACINFMNLATARSARRAKEIGLRKVSGAIRGQLILQFLSESVLISFFALLLALMIVGLFLPAFNALAGKDLAFDYSDARFWCTLIGISLATGLISGSYPALFLSGFKPVKVLKGNVKSMGGNLVFRNAMVVTQFIVSILLLIGTVTIYNQLQFIRNRNPGYVKDNLLYMHMTGELWGKQKALKAELKSNPLTANFAVSGELPVNIIAGTLNVQWEGKDPASQIVIPSMDVDENFIHVFKMKMLAGRGFSPEFTTDTNNYVINEKMMAVMGLNRDNAVGKTLTFGGTKGNIIGVVKDFNFKPVQQAIEPLVLRLNTYGGYIIVRTRPRNTENTINALAQISKQLNPAYPFKYDFLDQEMASLYKGEQKMGSIFNLFAGLAIFISCLGLYGLSAFMAEQRTREIGVRKVLGASLLNIVYLLSTGFARLILIAIAIAVPLSWYVINRWLDGYAYHINIGWAVFVVSSLAALIIALLTVSYESLKVATVNPVKSLRSE